MFLLKEEGVSKPLGVIIGMQTHVHGMIVGLETGIYGQLSLWILMEMKLATEKMEV